MSEEGETVSAAEAAALLGVKLPTLYAYASRGLLRSVPSTSGRAHRYLRDDVIAWKARAGARSGHAPVAASALGFGEPVLDSSITEIGPTGPRYRGHDAVALARAGTSFEATAELLWTGALPQGRPALPRVARFGVDELAVRQLLAKESAPLRALELLVPALGNRDDERFACTPELERARARLLLPRLAAGLALGGPARDVEKALREPTFARVVARALGAKPNAVGDEALEQALVVIADHELNASAFGARVAASAGADLYACLAAALAVVSGPRHGGACDRVEALVLEASGRKRPRDVVRERLARGEPVPGFGHRLYKTGDPRPRPLLGSELVRRSTDARVKALRAVVDAMDDAGLEGPTIDLGIVAVALALGMRPGAGTAIFAVGRSAGWVAHVLEQRQSDALIRPRARFIATR
jgi:citrate synthase